MSGKSLFKLKDVRNSDTSWSISRDSGAGIQINVLFRHTHLSRAWGWISCELKVKEMNILFVLMQCKVSQFLFMVIVLFSCSCQGSDETLYRLSKTGYAPDSNSMLVGIREASSDLETELLLAFNLDTGSGQLINRPQGFMNDFGWIPGEERFVSTHPNMIVLFHKESAGNRYVGTALKCPGNVIYLYCSWNPEGKWLAVKCFDYNTSNHVVGIYDSTENEFRLTRIAVQQHLVWKDNTTLYALSNNNVVEAKLEKGNLELVGTIAKYDRAGAFHGIIHGQAVVEKYEDVMLGENSLFSVKRPGGCEVAVTQDTIFITVKSVLVAFDHSGREIDRIDPKRIVHFGPVDSKNNQVFGVSGSTLLSIQVSKNGINIEDILELDKAKWMVQEEGERE